MCSGCWTWPPILRVPRTPSLTRAWTISSCPLFFFAAGRRCSSEEPQESAISFFPRLIFPHTETDHTRYRPGARLADAGGVWWCGLSCPSPPRASCAIVKEKGDRLCFAASRLGGRENGRPCASQFASVIYSILILRRGLQCRHGSIRYDQRKGQKKGVLGVKHATGDRFFWLLDIVLAAQVPQPPIPGRSGHRCRFSGASLGLYVRVLGTQQLWG